jgi:hypothetical protein
MLPPPLTGPISGPKRVSRHEHGFCVALDVSGKKRGSFVMNGALNAFEKWKKA